MATVNKDFKIKSGLIVEGTNATVNGNQVLTENASDNYILNLIGGETLVKSVESTQLEVDQSGKLSVKSGVFDLDGAADQALLDAKAYADGLASNYDPAGSAQTAENNAKSYADGLASNYDPAGSASTAETNAKNYTDNALGSYTKTSDLDTTIDGYGYLKSADLTGYATESYVDTEIANLVDGAPALLDTLNELAAAINDNPNYATDVANLVAGKQDTLTEGSNIAIVNNVISVTGLDTDDVAEGTNLYFTNQRALDATSSAYDVAGAAQTAQNNAETYTDNAINALNTDAIEEGNANQYFTDSRARTSAANLLTNASLTNITITGDAMTGLQIVAENGVADSTTDDLAEGQNNLYFTDSRAVSAISGSTIAPAAVEINNYRKEEATQQYVGNASQVAVHSFNYPYESAKYLVRVVGWDGGVKHSQVSEILVTTDGNNNVAITEYGVIHTSTNPLASFSAETNGSQVTLLGTTAVNGCEIIAAATMLSWAD